MACHSQAGDRRIAGTADSQAGDRRIAGAADSQAGHLLSSILRHFASLVRWRRD